MDADYPLIEDPLAWQAKIDAAGLSPNMRGSVRFWRTVEDRGLVVLYRDGVPDFTEIVFDLGGGVGLQLRDDNSFIQYRFVSTAEYTE